MELTAQQLAMLRAPFEEVGAFEGLSEDEIKKRVEEIADFYVTLANINLLTKTKSADIPNEK